MFEIPIELAPTREMRLALAYLAHTDWQVIRQMETGVLMDNGVKLKREAARLVIEQGRVEQQNANI